MEKGLLVSEEPLIKGFFFRWRKLKIFWGEQFSPSVENGENEARFTKAWAWGG